MQDLLPMDVQPDWAAYFYRRLLEHGSVDRAMNEARNTLFVWEDPAWTIPSSSRRLRDNLLFDLRRWSEARVRA